MKYCTNKINLFLLTFISLMGTLQLPVYANGASLLSNPILITEVMPGTDTSASEEFIEIYNQSKTAVDLAKDNWVIQITSSKATTWSGAKSVKLTGTLYPGTYAIVTSTYTSSGVAKSYLPEYANAQFSAGLTATSGHVRVGKTAVAPATGLQYVDSLEWSTKETSGSLTSAGIDEAVVYTLDSAIKAGSSIKRMLADDKRFIRSGDPARDWLLSTCPTPTSNSVAATTTLDPTIFEPLPTAIDAVNPSCVAIEEDSGSEGGGEIAPPTDEPPAILLPSETPATSPGTASTGASIPAVDKGLQSPQITELLPNPGSPNTDAADEFVELYNNNDATFDLSGFMLSIGTTGSKHVTFPDGTTIAPHSFKAFFSSELHLSLSNSSGKVALVDPLGNQLHATDDYGTAKDDTAWALAQGKWQWTTHPTPGATNVIAAPAPTSKKAATAKTKTSKATAKTTAAKQKSTKAATVSDMAAASSLQPDTPLHPLTLAVVGSFALLYGAYEYRRDLANRFHQLRSYRTARRAARTKLEGR
jgi:cell division septation protein DedD